MISTKVAGAQWEKGQGVQIPLIKMSLFLPDMIYDINKGDGSTVGVGAGGADPPH